jgi:hypothetical protein
MTELTMQEALARIPCNFDKLRGNRYIPDSSEVNRIAVDRRQVTETLVSAGLSKSGRAKTRTWDLSLISPKKE